MTRKVVGGNVLFLSVSIVISHYHSTLLNPGALGSDTIFPSILSSWSQKFHRLELKHPVYLDVAFLYNKSIQLTETTAKNIAAGRLLSCHYASASPIIMLGPNYRKCLEGCLDG